MTKWIAFVAMMMLCVGCADRGGIPALRHGKLHGRVELEDNLGKSLIAREEAKGFFEELGFKVLPTDFEGEPDYTVSLDGTHFPPDKDRSYAFHSYDLNVTNFKSGTQLDFGILIDGEPSAESKDRALRFLRSALLGGVGAPGLESR